MSERPPFPTPKLVAEDGKTPGKTTKGGAMTDVLWAAARALYETNPEITRDQLAKEFGVSATRIDRRAEAEGWRRATFSLAAMTDRAHQIADKVASRVSEELPSIGEMSALPEEAKAKVYAEIYADVGAEERARIIERHRQEWLLPRNLAYQSVNTKDFELAKLAKITTETLKNIQDGERKAWGLDRGEGDKTVVIQRE